MQFNASIYNNVTAPNGNNSFALTMDASEVAGQTFYFALFSLFPETFKARENGLRKDLAQSLYDLNPKFLRCPGGNNLEGESTQTRWKWWEQIGPLKDRPGRVGDWGYYNTGGLGLVEFMHWCEDMEMEPVLAVYSGYSLDGTSWPQDHMDQVLQEALDELEYLMGDESTTWGKKRIEHGFPDPFQINWVEIGNEDWFSNTYPRRFKYMYDGLKKAYPNITYISTAYDENPQTVIDIPAGAMWDTHHYVVSRHLTGARLSAITVLVLVLVLCGFMSAADALPGAQLLCGEFQLLRQLALIYQSHRRTTLHRRVLCVRARHPFRGPQLFRPAGYPHPVPLHAQRHRGGRVPPRRRAESQYRAAVFVRPKPAESGLVQLDPRPD
jgi:hypothetical protein